MKKNKKFLILAAFVGFVLTMSAVYGMWIILSEQIRGYVQSMGELVLEVKGNLYAGETWTYTADENSPNYATVKYTYYPNEDAVDAENITLLGTYTVSTTGASGEESPITVEKVKVTFVPSSQFFKWVWGEEIVFERTITLNAVAYDGTNYYTTIDAALGAVTSGTIYAIPSGDYTNIENPETGRARFAKTITLSEIKSGVTLCIPYDYSMKDESPFDGDKMCLTEQNGTNLQNSYNDHSAYCKNVVTVASTMTVHGTIKIHGQYHADDGANITGHTVGNYGELVIADGKTVTFKGTSELICRGFVTGSTTYGEGTAFDLIFESGTTLFMPIAFYDWRAGNNSLAIVDQANLQGNDDGGKAICSPIIRYQFPNIVGNYRVMAGSTVTTSVSVFVSTTSSTVHISTDLVGKPDVGDVEFIELAEDTYLDIFYDHRPIKKNKNGEITEETLDDYFGRLRWDLHGGSSIEEACKINPLSLSINGRDIIPIVGGLIGTIDVSSSGVFMPISYLLDMHIYGHVDTTAQDIRVLPGGRVTVEKGATLTGAKFMVSDELYKFNETVVWGDNTYTGYQTNFDTPPSPSDTSPSLSGGSLIVKGTLIATNVGGDIEAGDSGAKIEISSGAEVKDYQFLGKQDRAGRNIKTGYDLNKLPGIGWIIDDLLAIIGGEEAMSLTVYYDEVTETLSLDAYNGGTYAVKGTYYSAQKNDGTYAWYDSTFEVSFDANEGSFENGDKTATFSPSDSSYDGHVPLPEKPKRTYYTFSHWCTNKDCKGGPDSDCNVFDENGLSKNTYFTTPADPFYAIWTPITYTVNFVYTFNGEPLEEATLPEDITFTIENAEISLPELTGDLIPTYGEGEQPAQYQFGGWFTAAVGGNAVEGFGKQYCIDRADRETHEITIYARWTKRTYTVHFDFGEYAESMEFDSLTQQAGDYNPASNQTLSNLVTSRDNSLDQQYYFHGWYMNAEYTIQYKAEIGIDQEDLDKTEVTLYAKFIKKYFLKIQANDSTLDTDALASYTETWHKPGDTVNLPSRVYSNNADNTFDKTYYLASWTLNGAALTVDDANDPNRQINGDMTVSIVWANKVVLTIDYGENKLGIADETKYVIPGKSYPIAHDLSAGNDETDNSLYYDSIDQWTLTNCTISDKTITVGENVATASASLEWRNKRTVNYDVNGGDGNIATPQHYRPGGTGLTLPTPTRTGYTFNGWYTAATDGTRVGGAGDSYTPTENITLYAQWIQYTVTYNANGGNCSVSSERGGTMTLPTPTRTGYKFLGWYTAASGGDKIGDAGASYTPTANVTLYAQWTGYVVTYNANRGSVSPSSATYAGTALTLPTPTRTDYTFDGWYTAAYRGEKIGNAGASYTPTEDITLYAQWTYTGCVAEGTLITLADGTQKKVEDITADDLLLTFNHETGEFELRNLIYVHHMGEAAANHQVLNLRFSNGEILRIVASHGLFDLTLNDYVYISISNVDQYIGHEFFAVDYDGVNIKNEHIVLEEAYVTEEFVKVYSPVSVYNLNCFASGFLTLTTTSGNQSALFDIFDFDEDMKFDMEKKAEEIERYGLYSYEDFADHYTKEEFDYLLNYIESQSQFFKITLAKGRVAKEDIIKLFDFVLNS